MIKKGYKVHKNGYDMTKYNDLLEVSFEELTQYKVIHGHVNVSITDADNQKLAFWVRTQREIYCHFKAGNEQRSRGMCE